MAVSLSCLFSEDSRETLGFRSSSLSGPFKRDLYCWVCHTDIGPLLHCAQCPRALHRNCVRYLCSTTASKKLIDLTDSRPNIMKKCPECCVAFKTNFPNLKKTPADIHRKVCEAITRNLRDGYFWPNPFYNLEFQNGKPSFETYKDIVAKVMDINELERMADRGAFKTLEGLLGEVKWILHNTTIVHGKLSKEATYAKEITDFCELEIIAAEICPECFLHEHKKSRDPLWFARPCVEQQIHVLGWAKTPRNPHWPVKIMDWDRRAGMVTVRSFADYRRFEIPTAKVFVYSRKPPTEEERHKRLKMEDFRQAQEEIETHIDELRKAVGTVIIPEEVRPLSSFGSLNQLIKFMFPEWAAKMKILQTDADNAMIAAGLKMGQKLAIRTSKTKTSKRGFETTEKEYGPEVGSSVRK